MKLKSHLKITLIITVLLSITLFGVTYAYFVTSVKGNTNDKSITVSTGRLELTYYDGNGDILIEKIIPGTTIETKTFSVTNTGTNEVLNYKVDLESVENILVYKEDLKYFLTCKEYDEFDNYVKDCTGNDGEYPSSNTTLTTNSIKVDYTHKYELEIKYIETYQDQSEDMNKSIKGNVKIYDDTQYSNE